MSRHVDAERRRAALRHVMTANGLRPAAWARRAGVSANGIYNFLNGRSDSLSQRVLEALAEAAGCPLSQLVGDPAGAGPADLASAGVPQPRRRRDDPPPGSLRDLAMLPDLRARTGTSGEAPATGRVQALWPMSRAYLSGFLGVRDTASLAIAEIRGDSMEPTLRAGDRVVIDTADRWPAPPGLFAVADGPGTAIKRIEPAAAGCRPALRLTCDNPAHPPRESTVEEARIIGRVIWLGRAL